MARRALVIGASGQVGRWAAAALRACGWEVHGTAATRAAPGLQRVDLDDADALRAVVASFRPERCILAAAATNVEWCEEHPEAAFRRNAEAPGVVAEACRRYGGRTTFLSTEYVFDGTRGPYTEDDATSPISVYGAAKLEGERRVLGADPQNLVARTTVVFSYAPGDKNFAMQVLERGSAHERMRVPRDQVSSPTYAPDLGDALAALAEAERTGVLNVVGPDLVDRHALGVAMARALGLDPALLEPVDTAALGQKARRPLRAGLVTDRLRAMGIAIRGLDQALEDLRRRAAGAEPGAGPA